MTAKIINLEAKRQERLGQANQHEHHPLVTAGATIWQKPCTDCAIGDLVTLTLSYWALAQKQLTAELAATALSAVTRLESIPENTARQASPPSPLMRAREKIIAVAEAADTLTEKMRPLAELRIDHDEIHRGNAEARKCFAASLASLAGNR